MAQLQVRHNQQLQTALKSFARHQLATERSRLQKMQMLYQSVQQAGVI